MNATSENFERISPVKRALFELRKLRSQVDEMERAKTEPIAIIGMGCRFPGKANDPDTFWQLMDKGIDAIREVPADRWDVDAYYDPDPRAPGKMCTRWGGFLEGIDLFSPEFFGISPRETVSMDPQQRLLLEVVWEALENAGQAPNKLFGSSTGVFIGISSFDYPQIQLQMGDLKSIDAYFVTGGTHSVASGRISYVLGLQGPSISVDTACSSSLVAVHQACQSLRTEECDLALAGGVNLILLPEILINFSRTHIMALDGRCKAFDASADGFVRSEGCGIVVLKRLSDALIEKDNILAVIRGTAVNQDGRSSGLTVPNGPSQQDVIRKALGDARVDAAEIQYVEAHGTGTSLGDPIEVQALAAVLGQGRSPSHPLAIGSVKTNVGHLESAAGVAGLMKVVLALQHEKIPPHLHLQKLNPHIAWHEIPVVVPTKGAPWPAGPERRFAGVSSFGFSGTNAHVVVEEAPVLERASSAVDRPLHLLTLSAECEGALKDLAKHFADHLAKNWSSSLADAGYTANTGRSHFTHRLAVVADSAVQAQHQLENFVAGEKSTCILRGQNSSPTSPEVVFMFTGQGAQYVGMCRQLYETQPTFRTALDRCDELLRSYLEEPLLAVIYPADDVTSTLDETGYTQPALFALEYALAELWRSCGIKPAAVIGHSLGEYVAACVAGVFSLEDGLMLVVQRARLMQTLASQGMMAAVFSEEDRVRKALTPHEGAISISAVNSPQNVVVSGERNAVERVLAQLEDQGISAHVLRVSHAFHSPLVKPMLEPFEEVASQVKFEKPVLPVVSNLTGEVLNHDDNTWPKYWRRHASKTVKFAAGIRTLYELGYRIFVEIGPSATLCGLGQQCLSDEEVVWLPSLRRSRDDWQQMLESLGELHVRGVEVDWAGFDRDYDRRKVVLPTYPFQRERYWVQFSQNEPREQQSEDPSPVYESAVTAGRLQSMQVPIDLELHTYETKWRCLYRLITSYIVHTLREFSVYAEPEESHSVDELLQQLGIVTTYRGLLSRWLARLATEGLLQQQGNLFIASQPLPDPNLESRLAEAREALADIPFLQDYIERCGDLLTEVLTGKESPLETLFPGGSSHIAESIYQHWPLSRYFNNITAAVIESFVKNSPHDSHVRLLEVGAGTGGTTSAVLPVLQANRTLYLYTDISEVFFSQAKRKFKAYPFVSYGSLDIEQSPHDQGYGLHGFDIVIASNVLHATRNLEKTVRNILSLIAPDGLLLLYEVTEPHSWFDTTVSLIEGWQLFDDNLRQNGPLLGLDQWKSLLQTQGFRDVVAFPETGSPAEILKAHVMVARAPSSQVYSEGHLQVEFPKSPKSEAQPIGPDKRDETTGQDVAEEFIRRLKEATPGECRELLIDYVREHVIRVLNRDASKPLNRNQRLMDLGVDSLMAVELRNSLGACLGLKRPLPATLIFDYATIDAVAEYLANEAVAPDSWPEESSEEPEDGSDPMNQAAVKIEDLSEQEVEKLVMEKLESLGEEE